MKITKLLIYSIFIINYINLYGCTTSEESTFSSSNNESCERLKSESQALAELDLSDPAKKQIHDTLLAMDRSNGYQIFIRSPDDFMIWMKESNLLSLSSLSGRYSF